MSDQPITRVHYYDGQYLRLVELTDEQAYHIGMRRRHNIGGHSWGIVRGLALGLEDAPNGQGPYVGPGMAVDGYGRELILVARRSLDPKWFDIRDSNVLDIWLTYGRSLDSPVAAGYGDCTPANQEPDEFDRFLEDPILLYEAADSNTDRRHHSDIPDADVDFGPQRTPPDDVESPWPVYLGRLSRKPKSPTNLTSYVYQIDLSGRPYAGLVGEWIIAPSGLAVVQLGVEPPPGGVYPLPAVDPAPSPLQRFAVFVRTDPRGSRPVPANGQAKQPSRLQIGRNGIVKLGGDQQAPRLEIDDRGNVTLLGHTTLLGDLTLDGGGAAEFRAAKPDTGAARAAATRPKKAATAVPRVPPPWTIYKSVDLAQGQAADQTAQTGDGGTATPPTTTATGAAATAAAAATSPPPAAGGTTSPPPAPSATVHDLRVVIDDDRLLAGQALPSDQLLPDAPNRFSVGSFSKDAKTFQPVLVVSNQGVTVYGNLTVMGQIKSQQEQVSGPLTPQALALTTSAYFNGLTDGGAPIAGLDPTPLDGLARMIQNAAGRAAIKEFLQRKQLLSPMIGLLFEVPDAVNALLRSFVS
jgi:hypothetical protein